MMVDYGKYRNIIFDFDGVVVDSNFIKSECIYLASLKYCNSDYHTDFVNFFTHNNGVPREIKISKYFDIETSNKILKLITIYYLRD